MLGGLLQVEVEGGLHLEAALVDGRCPVEVFQLLIDEVHEVRRLTASVLLEHELQRLVLRLLGLRARDHVAVDHGLQHDRLPRQGAVLVQGRIVVGGTVGQPGEHR